MRAVVGQGVRWLSPIVASLALAGALSVGALAAPAHADGIDDLVTRFYTEVLERPPEADGAAAWSTFLRGNCNASGFDALAQSFFGSNEFVLTKRQTLEQLVAKFYRALLAREPEPAGVAAWGAVLRKARVDIALAGFVPSREFQSLLPDRTDRAAVTSVVARLYAEILQRTPDPAEASSWVDFIVTTGNLEQVARGFLTSPEFESQPLTFLEYVTLLYRTFLAREPDLAETTGWVNVLTQAMLIVINTGFVPSVEFQGLSAALCPIPSVLGTYTGTLDLNVTGCTPSTDNGPFVVAMVVSVTGQSAGQFGGSGLVVAIVNNVQTVIATLVLSGTVTSSGGVSGSFTLQSNPPGFFTTIGSFGGVVTGDTMSLSVVTQDLPPNTCHGVGTYVGTRR